MTNDPVVEGALNVLAPDTEPDVERALRRQLALQSARQASPAPTSRGSVRAFVSRHRFAAAGLALFSWQGL